jgi:hypothetical protein
MSETTPPAGRLLTEPEFQAFQRLGLTPGHWAALAPAPLFYQDGVQAPNCRSENDLTVTERLRRALRTLEGLSGEAVNFWDRLGDGTRSAEATLATRLLAWHMATDATFARRSSFFQLLQQSAEQFAPGGHPERTTETVREFRKLVDAYLPHRAFLLEANPPLVAISQPTAVALEWVANTITSPLVDWWPSTNFADVPRLFPTLVQLLGESVWEWWGLLDPARWAAERGLANLPFADRQRLYAAVFGEWHREVLCSDHWQNARDLAHRFANRLWEWADAVRLAEREITRVSGPVAPLEDAAPVIVSPVAPLPVAIPVVMPVVMPKTPVKPQPERVTATVAAAFTMVTLDAALARARATTVASVCAWVDSAPRLLFDGCRDDASRAVAVVRSDAAVPPALWVIGDVHADVLTLANVIAYAESRATPEQPACYLFLGDFVDRGIHDHETLLLLFGLMMAHPDRVCVVPGNHDIDLQFDKKTERFKVTIEPAEYCANLNAALTQNAPGAAERVALARAFIRFRAERPKAVFLPDGTLFTHGGFPHSDEQKEIKALADLCRPRCVDDFLWARIAESARVKRPNRGSRGHEFGWDTLAQFAKLAGERLGLPVKRLVRGHDHVPDRWQEYPEYADNGVPVLTINAMGRALDGDPPRREGRPHPYPVVARYVPDHLPEVVLLPLDSAEVERAFLRTPNVAESGRPAEGAP